MTVPIRVTREMLRVGKQVVYIPRHTLWMYNTPEACVKSCDRDIEFGFVSSWNSEMVFCRFWSRQHNGLRTTADSEGCHINDIWFYPSRKQEHVDKKIEALRSNVQEFGWCEQEEGEQK